MTNGEGCPVAVSVYAGNTGDPTTVADQIEKLREQFRLQRVVLVGDRGMLTQPQIDKLKQHPGLGWITALTSTAIQELVKQGALQLSLLDEKNLAEITAPDYPGERLMVCHNPVLGEQRQRKRQALLKATEKSLEKISKEVARRKNKPLTAVEIGVKVGKVLGRYKMGKPSDSAERKKRSHQTADGLPVHSFESLLRELASRARVTYALKPQKAEEKTNLTFRQVPEPTPVQARAYELVRTFPVTAR